MRTTIFILAAATVAATALTACNDDRPTAPRSSGQSQRAVSEQSPAFDISSGNKPVKFTVTTVASAGASFGGVGNNFGYPTQGTTTATCPAGTTVIGGGYKIGNSDPEQLAVLYDVADGSNGWSAKVLFTGTLTYMAATIFVYATCLQ
jgi:hypothetical protein